MSKHPRRVPDRIQDMLEAIAHIRLDMGDLDQEQFLADGKTQRAVSDSFIVIGEAAKAIMELDPGIEQRAPSFWKTCRNAYGVCGSS